MSNSRDEILVRVRAAEQGIARTQHYALPDLPYFPCPAGNRSDRFCSRLASMGGDCVAMASIGAFADWFCKRFPNANSCAATEEVTFARQVGVEETPTSLHNVDVGIVRARYGVAETGSVWLSECEYKVSALGYLAQHLVVLLDPNDIVDGIQDVYRLRDFQDASYAVLVSGPSATADIEGVLIRGAQGVRSLTVVLLKRPVSPVASV